MADPIQEQHRAIMNQIAKVLDEFFNPEGAEGPKIVFTLLVAEAGRMAGGRVNYISNGDRPDMLTMIRELLARMEGRYAEPKEGEKQ